VSTGWVAYAPFNEDVAAHAVRSAGQQAGVLVEDIQLIRLGENAVFRVGHELVARVARPHADRAELQRLVDVAQWLAREQLPAVRVLDVDQPIRSGGLAVTFWHALGDDTSYGVARDLGNILRRLHDLATPTGLDLPALDPFERAERRLDVVSIEEDDRAFLRDRLEQLRQGYAELAFQLPPGHVHGDASVGNVLLDRHGTPTLIDLDGFAIGPREWDLVLTAVFYERFGWHTEREYDDFVEAYGYDVRQWSGYPVLADVREFLMVTWIAQRADESQKLADEVAMRIESLRTGGSRRGWHPY
jgi:Ser/Thr protein kinase RdoA (MazF antagonist)